MKSVGKRFSAIIILLTIAVGVLPANPINVFASYASGDGWEQINENTFVFYNNVIIGSELIKIFNMNGEVESEAYKFAYTNPDTEGKTWNEYGIEVDSSAIYDIEFDQHDCAVIYFSPKKYWGSYYFYSIKVEKDTSPETTASDFREPATVDNLQNKDFGKFDTEAEFMSAVKDQISASWENSNGVGKIDPQYINVEFSLIDKSANADGETVQTYSVTVSIIEGENWLASEQTIEDVHWRVNQYVITFDTNGGTEIAPIKQDFGTAITQPEHPTKSGYNFIGWDKLIPSTMPGEDMVITAKWEEATQMVSFDPNGGNWDDDSDGIKIETLNVNYSIENYQTPDRAGYNFGGWEKLSTSISDADISYKAVWNPGKTVTFKDGDTVYSKNYALGELISVPRIGEKIGYTFIGWDIVGPNGVGDGFKDSVISVMGNESLIYIAMWKANDYTVVFYNENNEIIEAITEKYGNKYAVSITPTKTGYSFVGWDLKKDGKYDGIADAVSATMGAENLEYRELFAIGQYTITFDSAGGSTVESITQSYGTAVIPPEHPIKEGFVFEGWDGGIPGKMPARNITLTAKWKRAVYIIKWDINDDGIINDYDIVTTVEHGESPKLPDAVIPHKDSTSEFSFLFGNRWFPEIKPADGEATYTAQFDAIRRKYTVRFLNFDGTVLQSSEVEYGSIPVYGGATPTKSYDVQYEYIFAGWLPNLEAVTGETEYTAKFDESLKKYTVVWQNWDGSVLETDVGVEHGSLPKYDGKTPAKPSTAEKTYIFEGWQPQISGIDSDMIYIASFTEKINKYTVTWKNDDGSVINITEVEYGQIPVYATPSKPSTPEYSYVFIGWTPDVVAVTCDAAYTASYTAEKNKYSVVWIVNGEETTEIYEYGAVPAFKGSTDKAADGCTEFTFVGWDKNIGVVTGNIEYTADYSTATVHTSNEFVYLSNNGTHTKKHKCCSAVVTESESCSDISNDGDHKCDLCGADNIGSHYGGIAACKTLARCAECEKSYGTYDAANHESEKIIYSDINTKTHDEFFACCHTIRIDNISHTFVDGECICGAKEVITVSIMIGDTVFKIIETSSNAELNIEDIPDPTPTKGYVFAGWHTADGVRIEGDAKLKSDLVLYAKYFAGDVDGSGKLEKSDVVALNRYIIGDDVVTVDDKNALDVNGDGKITVLDSVILMLYIAGKYS